MKIRKIKEQMSIKLYYSNVYNVHKLLFEVGLLIFLFFDSIYTFS